MNDFDNYNEQIIETAKSINAMVIDFLKQMDEIKSGFQPLFDLVGKLVSESRAVNILLENQIIMADRIPFDLEQRILESDNIPELIEKYYTCDNSRRLKKLIKRCQERNEMKKHQDLYSQILEAYHIGSYHLACMGLFAIADELMSSLSNLFGTGTKNRITEIEKDVKVNVGFALYDPCLLSAYSSLSKEEYLFYESKQFNEDEPKTLNRHWTMHGRSTRVFQRIDFIRVLLWIDALIRLAEYKGE